ncbi:MAG: glycosyltransferase [Acidobacteria bacterium]|jgi:glycosyltransferase involved in cell wall biosynthesis|nr:glycosyltransferase [Acidobacteriota bacterium]
MRVLLVASRSPVPAWRGNQARTVEWLEALAGHDLALVCPGTSEPFQVPARVTWMPHSLSPAARSLGLARAAIAGHPLQEGLYDSGAARRVVRRGLGDFRPEVVIVQMVRCGWAADLVRQFSPHIPLIFDAIDAMGLHFERAARSVGPTLSFAYRSEALRCRLREREIAEKATITAAVSERDLAFLSVPGGRACVIPVSGREMTAGVSQPGAPVVLLSGNLGYRPTIRGALWFAKEIWPHLRIAVPGARWVLAGARPSRAVRRLGKLAGVEVHADVPDLEPFLAGARVAIAPMNSGSGVPMKVLEAMAAGVATVVHPWAANGLVDEAREAVVQADDADQWVERIKQLLSDPSAAQEIGHRGRSLWDRFYHPARVAEQIRNAVEEAVGAAN